MLIKPDSDSDFTEPEDDPDLEELMQSPGLPKESTMILEVDTVLPQEGSHADFEMIKREFIQGLEASSFSKANKVAG
jgi:hypothetical protein